MRLLPLALLLLLVAAAHAAPASASASASPPEAAAAKPQPAKTSEPPKTAAPPAAEGAHQLKEAVLAAVGAQLKEVIEQERHARNEIVAQVQKTTAELVASIDALKRKVESAAADKDKDAATRLQNQAASAAERTGEMERVLKELKAAVESSLSAVDAKVDGLRQSMDHRQQELMGAVKAAAAAGDWGQWAQQRVQHAKEWYAEVMLPSLKVWAKHISARAGEFYMHVNEHAGPSLQRVVDTSRDQVLQLRSLLHQQVRPVLGGALAPHMHDTALLVLDVLVAMTVALIFYLVLSTLLGLCCGRRSSRSQSAGEPASTPTSESAPQQQQAGKKNKATKH